MKTIRMLLVASLLMQGGAAFSTGTLLASDLITREVSSSQMTMHYAVQLPPHYAPEHPWPVVVFLHGSGAEGEDAIEPTRYGLGPAIDAHPERFPAVIYYPQTPPGGAKWAQSPQSHELESLVLRALENVVTEYHGDRSRIYITGMSRGGGGAWAYAADNASHFAALLPIQGFGNPRVIGPALAHMPIWAFHGDSDQNISVQKTRDLVMAARDSGNTRVKYTEFEGADHDIFDRVYGDPEVIAWLFSQRLGS